MRIGLTGGVGCGVSVVANYIKGRGVPVISGDKAGHLALADLNIREKLNDRFGNEILDKNGSIDRTKLGSIVFSDHKALKDLNRIIHPTLLEILKSQVEDAERTNPAVVVDAALIYEWNMSDYFDIIIVVAAPTNTRIARAMQRNGLSRNQVNQRISAQMSLHEKSIMADFIIYNDGTLEELYRKTDQIINKIPTLREIQLKE